MADSKNLNSWTHITQSLLKQLLLITQIPQNYVGKNIKIFTRAVKKYGTYSAYCAFSNVWVAENT